MDKEIFVDANIFLEILLKDSKSEECKGFLRSTNDKGLITSDFIVYSCLINIENNLKNKADLKAAIIFFNNIQNLKILRPSFDELYAAVEIMENSNLDFDDGLVVACMRNYGIKKLASLDRHFDRIKGMEKVKI